MPMGAPSPAAPHPTMVPAPAHAGPATMPQGNQGNAAKAMLDVRNAVKMLEQALPMIPMGSPLHEKIHKVALDLSKELNQGDENPALQLQSLVQMMRSASQAQPMNALGRMFPGQSPTTPPATGGASPPPEQPPA